MITGTGIRHVATGALLILSILPSAVSGLHAQPRDVPHRVEMSDTELLRMASPIVGREFEIDVHLPGNYADPDRRFSVIYVLDAQWDFSLVTSLYGQQYYDGFMPASIVVGITWGGTNPPYDSLRARDLTPTFNKQMPQSGNGGKFLSFITSELIPMIDSMYRTNTNDRTLMGSSLGGLFTLYAMFHETKTFNRYVAASPSLWWDGEVMYDFEHEYASKRPDIPIKLFLAEGELETGAPQFKKFVATLESRGYKGLKFHARILDGMGHSGSKAEGFTRGLQYVFERASIAVSPSVLKQYIGTYELRPGMTVRLDVEGGTLVARTPDNMKLSLLAETEKDFFVKGIYSVAHFEKDGSGNISGFRWEQYSGEQFVKKIE